MQNFGETNVFLNASEVPDLTSMFGNEPGNIYVAYAEGIYVGYKYYETRYEDVVLGQGNAGNFDYAAEVAYPFGYGLSYTTFGYSDFAVTESNGGFTATVTVTNTGDVAGRDVVQIYMQSPYTDYDRQNGVEKSAVQLVGFAKAKELAPSATEKVTINIDRSVMRAYDSHNAKTYSLCQAPPCGRYPMGQREVHEHEALGDSSGGLRYCWLTLFRDCILFCV